METIIVKIIYYFLIIFGTVFSGFTLFNVCRDMYNTRWSKIYTKNIDKALEWMKKNPNVDNSTAFSKYLIESMDMKYYPQNKKEYLQCMKIFNKRLPFLPSVQKNIRKNKLNSLLK